MFCHLFKKLNVNRYFILDGKRYNYFYHSHGSCFNERCVEIPICLDLLKKYDYNDVLEVGNVIGMYMPVYHQVLDKYDKSIGVINEDVVSFNSCRHYKLIFSISTLEHVGFDEWKDKKFSNTNKVIRSVNNLKRLLGDDGGKLVVTMPLGFRESLDEFIYDNLFDFSSCFFMKRISHSNRWVQMEKNKIDGIRFNSPFPKAHGLFIGIFEK